MLSPRLSVSDTIATGDPVKTDTRCLRVPVELLCNFKEFKDNADGRPCFVVTITQRVFCSKEMVASGLKHDDLPDFFEYRCNGVTMRAKPDRQGYIVDFGTKGVVGK